MVYCGKPSRGCQMCRTRRIKCDETKPTCTQCRKSRRECPGYKDDFDLVFRNETQATEKRAKKPAGKAKKTESRAVVPLSQKRSSNPSPLPQSHTAPIPAESSRPTQVPAILSLSIEQTAANYFFNNYVVASSADGGMGLTDYMIPLASSITACKHLNLAFNAVSLAAFGNLPNVKSLLPKAQEQYSKAIRHVNDALRDPVAQRTDETLASVMLLGKYESILTRPVAVSAWNSHIEGAVMLVKMRGRKQFRTKTGNSLFAAVRNLMLIHCLATGKKPDWGSDMSRGDAKDDDRSEVVIRLMIQTAELRCEINKLMTIASRTPENVRMVRNAMQRSFDMEKNFLDWIFHLPETMRFTAVAWVDSISSDELVKSDVYPGRIDSFPDIWIAHSWTLVHVSRLFISGAIVRCAAWLNTSIDYRTTPEYATAARMGAEAVNDLIASIPYHLGWEQSKRSMSRIASAGDESFASGSNQNIPKALGAYICVWPTFSASCSDFATDTQRTWLRGRLRYINDELGINQAGVLSLYQLRLPSMTIKRDLMTRNAVLISQPPDGAFTPPYNNTPSPPHSSNAIPTSTSHSMPQSTTYNSQSKSSAPVPHPSNNPAAYPASSHPPSDSSTYAPQVTAHFPYVARQESPPDEHLPAAIESSNRNQWEQWERERRRRDLDKKEEALVDEATGGDELLAELIKKYFSVGMLDK